MTVKPPEAYTSFPPLHFPVSRLTHTATCESAEFDTTSQRTHIHTVSPTHTHTHTVSPTHTQTHAQDCTHTPLSAEDE